MSYASCNDRMRRSVSLNIGLGREILLPSLDDEVTDCEQGARRKKLREGSKKFSLPIPSLSSSLNLPFPFPLPFSYLSCFLPLPSLFPFPSPNPGRVFGECCKLPSGFLGKAPTEIEFGAF